MSLSEADFLERLGWHVEGSDIVLGEHTLSSVAEHFGTPLYVYDAKIILDRMTRVREAFPTFDVLYSVKANPNPTIVKILLDSGLGAGVSSLDELKLVLRLGCPRDKVALGGPAHRHDTLKAATKAKIGMINVESKRELMTLEEIGKRSRSKIGVALRINTSHRPRVAREFMAGGPSQFGMDEEGVVEELQGLELKRVKYEGIHTFVASQVLELASLTRHFHRVADISQTIAKSLHFELKYVNFGGGFGIPYSPDDSPLNINLLGQRVTSGLEQTFPDRQARPKFIIEVGRYLVGECGVFLTEILDVKRSRGHDYIITDSGINGLSRPVMPWAQEHLCTIVSKAVSEPTRTYNLVGPTCMPSDAICENIALPDAEVGDVVGISNAGAYGYTMTMLLWASQPLPAEVLFHDGEFTVIRKRARPLELLVQ